MSRRLERPVACCALLAGQSVSAFMLFWTIFPIFVQLATHLGERQDLQLSDQIAIVGWSALLQCCYWIRLLKVAMLRPRQNVFVSHLSSFASRVSFFFGGALFSAVFFRHLPELAALPPIGQALLMSVYVVAVLFGLFCYSLELERLAKSFDVPTGSRRGEP